MHKGARIDLLDVFQHSRYTFAMVLQMCLLYTQELVRPYDANKQHFHQAEVPPKCFL